MANRTDLLATSGSADGPAWKRRAVDRSTQVVKQRAELRVERFLDAAQLVIAEKGSTDFTVQEVVDRSHQSLRSFYLHFDGKHELLLALFEDALSASAQQIRTATDHHTDPLAKLEIAVRLLFDSSRPSGTAQRPLFTEFASQLLASHPTEVKVAHAPLLRLLAELVTEAAAAGQLRAGVKPRRMAALIMQTAMLNAHSSGAADDGTGHPLTADEIWLFCANGFARN
jgi:AcrR family transcriptional regulator